MYVQSCMMLQTTCKVRAHGVCALRALVTYAYFAVRLDTEIQLAISYKNRLVYRYTYKLILYERGTKLTGHTYQTHTHTKHTHSMHLVHPN